jgi:hypothetical protein
MDVVKTLQAAMAWHLPCAVSALPKGAGVGTGAPGNTACRAGRVDSHLTATAGLRNWGVRVTPASGRKYSRATRRIVKVETPGIPKIFAGVMMRFTCRRTVFPATGALSLAIITAGRSSGTASTTMKVQQPGKSPEGQYGESGRSGPSPSRQYDRRRIFPFAGISHGSSPSR